MQVYVISWFNLDLALFIIVTLQALALLQIWSEEHETFYMTSLYMYLLEVSGDLELVLRLGKALSGLIILSIWEESLCVLYSAQALTNQSAAYIFHYQSESRI